MKMRKKEINKFEFASLINAIYLVNIFFFLHIWIQIMDPLFMKMFNADIKRMGIKTTSFSYSQQLSTTPYQKQQSLTYSEKTSTSVRSALCIIPDESQWTSIQNIRRSHDPAYPRWMPHINIFFPFIEEIHFDKISKYIQNDIVRKNNIKSFNIELHTFDVFDRVKYGGMDKNKTETLFLKPTGCSTQLQNIFDYLKDDWPVCASKHSEFNPHLTVGKFKVRDINTHKSSFQSSWRTISFQCNSLYLISRRGSDPFKIRHTISLC
eukprot:512469_1